MRGYTAHDVKSVLVGAGKSTLVSIIIDEISTRITAANEERLSYFYCNKASRPTELESPSTILRSIVKQLSRFDDEPIMDLVANKYKEKIGAGHLNRPECVEIIRKLTNLYPMTTIIIDGLDEAPKEMRSDFLTDLHEIMTQSLSLVKVFVASRSEPDIKLRFGDFENEDIASSLRMGIDDNTEDIQRFVHERLAEDIKTHRLLPGTTVTEGLKQKIASTLISKAQGM